jgi:hypothetical protein
MTVTEDVIVLCEVMPGGDGVRLAADSQPTSSS